MALSPKVLFALVAVNLLAAITPRPAVAQQHNIATDRSFGSPTTLTGPNYAITANLGRQVGGNLFHSFDRFGLATGERAIFTPPPPGAPPVANVIGRVTGGVQSSINGSIVSNSITGASLYLINPSGIVFGSNATVNVSGSFHASTANYLKMADGTKIPTGSPESSTFSAARPAAFGFLTTTPANIMVNGSTLAPGPTPSGTAPANLGLIAGPVAITGGTLRAPAGTIQVTGVASAGEVPVDPRNPSALPVTSFASVGIRARSLLTASTPAGSGSGGSVFIRAGGLTISDASTVAANNAGSGPGGQLVLRGDSEVTLRNNTSVQASTSGGGSGAAATISTAGTLTIDGSTIQANSTGRGPGGQLVLRGDNQVTLSGSTSVQALATGSGSGAGVTISTAPTGMIRVDASTLTIGSAVSAGSAASGNGGSLSVQTGQLTLSNGGAFTSLAQASGNGSPISINAGSVLLDGGAALKQSTEIFSTTSSTASNAGRGGSITIVAGELTVRNGAGVLAQTNGRGAGGGVGVTVDDALTIQSGAQLGTKSFAAGNAGDVSVAVAGMATIDMSMGALLPLTLDGIGSFTLGSGNAGNVSVAAGNLAIANSGAISSFAASGTGSSGDVVVRVSGMLSIDGLRATRGAPTGISADSLPQSRGNAGQLTVAAGGLSVINDGEISSNANGPAGNAGGVTISAGGLTMASSGRITSDASGPGNGGSISVTVGGQLTIDGSLRPGRFPTEIAADSLVGAKGNAGGVTVNAGTLSIVNGGVISSDADASVGNPGHVTVTADNLIVAGPGSSIESNTSGSGSGGGVALTAGNLTITGSGAVRASTFGAGDAGSVVVRVAGGLSIDGAGTDPTSKITGISSQANEGSTGAAGSVTVSAGNLSIVNGGTITTAAFESGNAGAISVSAGALLIGSSGEIVSSTHKSGQGGSVSVAVDGQLTIDGAASAANLLTEIAANSLAGSIGNAGNVTVAAGALTIVNGGTITSSTLTPSNLPAGNAGQITIRAGALTVANGGLIASATEGTGRGGNVSITAGSLTIGGGDVTSTSFGTGVGSGPAGDISIDVTGNQPGALTILANGSVRASTFGPGDAGSVAIRVAGGLSIDGTGANPSLLTGISSQAAQGSTGNAGDVAVTAGTLSLVNGGAISSSALHADNNLAASSGNAGNVTADVAGLLSLSGSRSRIATETQAGTTGDAGSVAVTAGQISLTSGGEIISTTAGTGAGGSVSVTTAGALVLDGGADPSTQIAASATGSQSGPGGTVTVQARSLTVEGRAQIASSTAGPGTGGNVNITVASDIVLPDPGPQISALSTGGGDAGTITVSAVRLLMNDGSAISTDALGERSVANGGNIILHVRDLLFLTSSEISTSVKGFTGNGGNITIDPLLVILDHSIIKADAIAGHGGNITITADQFIPSSDSRVEATSEFGAQGTVVINGLVNANGALAVLSTQLRSRVEVLREACESRGGQPISSLVEAGRGGLPQDPEATLPALYIAGRDLVPQPQVPGGAAKEGAPVHTTARLTMRCS